MSANGLRRIASTSATTPASPRLGNGAHACAGQGLRRLETTAMLSALVERVDRIELTGTPVWAMNNIIRRHAHLPIKLIAGM